MEVAEEVVVERVAGVVVVPLSELVQATVRVVVQGMVVLMGTGMQVVEVEVGVAEEVVAVGELKPPGLDQATVQDMDPVLVTGQEVEGGKVAAAVVVPDLVQGFVFLIGIGMQVAEVEVAVAKTLREVHHRGMDQGAEVGTEEGVVVAKEVGEEEEEAMEVELVQNPDPDPDMGKEVDRDMGQETAAGRRVYPEVEEMTRSEERRVGKECRSRWSPYH